MSSRNPIFALPIISLLVASLACSLLGAVTPTPNSNSASQSPATSAPTNSVESDRSIRGACVNPLYPVAVGASWTYQFKGSALGNFTRSITAVNADGFTDQDVFTSGITRYGEWKCNAGALIALKPSSGADAAVQSDSVESTFETTAMDGVTLPASVNQGDAWSQNFTMEGTESINGQDIASKSQIAFSCTAGANESVTVPAGTFNAVHMDCISKIDITITMNGVDVPTTVNTTSTMWYAPGVGLVKSEDVVSGSQNVTLELTAYYIP